MSYALKGKCSLESIKVKGIVLKSTDSKEKDKLLYIFTLEKGLLLAKIKGVKNANAKLKIFSQPFCVAEFILADKNGFYTITNCDVIETFFDVTKDYDKYINACMLLDALRSSVILVQGSEKQAFVALLKALRELTYSAADVNLVVIKFMSDLARICGYKIDSSFCSTCGEEMEQIYLNLDDYSFCCTQCKPYNCEEFDKAAYKLLSLIENTDYDRLSSLKINGLTSTIAYTFIKKYIEKNLMISLLKC